MGFEWDSGRSVSVRVGNVVWEGAVSPVIEHSLKRINYANNGFQHGVSSASEV